MSEKDVKYTKHSLRRARERKLWKYVSKEKFFYDAKHLGSNTAVLGDCVYAYVYEPDNKIKITTMYRNENSTRPYTQQVR